MKHGLSLRQRISKRAAGYLVKMLGSVGYDLTNIHESSWWRGMAGDSWGTHSYVGLAQLAADNPYAGRAKWLFGQLASSLPLMVREVASGDDERTDFPEHAILKTLRRPNEDQSYQTWILELCEHLWFGGEVLMEFSDMRLTGSFLTGAPAGTPGPLGINLLRPDGIERIEYRHDNPVKPLRYHYKVPGSRVPRREILAEFVFRIKIPGNVDEPDRGFPLFRWGRRAAILMASGDKWNKSVYDGGGRAGGVLTWQPPKPGMKMGKDRLQEIVDATSEQMATARKEGSLVFIPDDFKLQKDGTTAREQDWLGGDKNNARKVVVAMGFDPSLFGDSENKTYSNMRAALRAALMLNVIPVMDWFWSEVNARLMPRYDVGTNKKYEIYIQRNTGWIGELLQEDTTERSTRLRAEIISGIRTRLEARAALDLTGDLSPEDEELAGRLTVPAGTMLLDGIATDLLALARLLDPERKTVPAPPTGGDGLSMEIDEELFRAL